MARQMQPKLRGKRKSDRKSINNIKQPSSQSKAVEATSTALPASSLLTALTCSASALAPVQISSQVQAERTVEVTKLAGTPAGVGLRGVGNKLLFAYVESDSVLANHMSAGEQLLSINGTTVSGATPRDKHSAGTLLREASELQLVIRSSSGATSLASAARTARLSSSMKRIATRASPPSLQPSAHAPGGQTCETKQPNLDNDEGAHNDCVAEEVAAATDDAAPVSKWKLALTRWSQSEVAEDDPSSPETKVAETPQDATKRAVARFKKVEILNRVERIDRVKEKRKEVQLRSDCVYYTRSAIAWGLNWLTYVWITFTVVIYAGMYGPEATTDILINWFASVGMAVGIIEPINILAVALVPLLFSEDGCCFRWYNRCFFVYNEYFA